MTIEQKEYCQGCEHLGKLWPDMVCNYLLDTGHVRGCPAGPGCLHHSNVTFDDRALALFLDGKTDSEMAEELKIGERAVRAWRSSRGMLRPRGGARPRKKKRTGGEANA